MFPVVLPPMVNVLFLKLCMDVPDALNTNPRLLLVADSVATGAPAAIPVTANNALEVAVPPNNKSCVVLFSKIAPDPWLNGDPPFATGRTPEM